MQVCSGSFMTGDACRKCSRCQNNLFRVQQMTGLIDPVVHQNVIAENLELKRRLKIIIDGSPKPRKGDWE